MVMVMVPAVVEQSAEVEALVKVGLGFNWKGTIFVTTQPLVSVTFT